MTEQKTFPSKIAEKHPNSKFCRDSKAWWDRKARLADIIARQCAGQSFGDLQQRGR